MFNKRGLFAILKPIKIKYNVRPIQHRFFYKLFRPIGFVHQVIVNDNVFGDITPLLCQ